MALRRNRSRVLKNAGAEAAQFRRRSALAFVGVMLALLGLAGWYFRLQVLQHEDYATRSEANRIKLQPIVPGRGLIYDRKGRILADNVPAYRLDVTPSEAGEPSKWLPRLSGIVAFAPEDLEHFDEVRHVSRGFKPVTLKLRVTEEEAARFAVDRWRYPGVELVAYLNRRYPYGELTAHVIGYVGRVDVADAKAMGPGFDALTHVGKTGLERSYEDALRGRIGYQKIETNVEGRAVQRVGQVPAQPGADLRLSIDIDLQQAMVTAFGDMDGAAVAVDPRTGEVLAMVSLPSYDANLFVNGITHKAYSALTTNPSRPLFNRPLQGGGPPGSTIKPLFGLAGLDSGLRTPQSTVFSTGEFHIPGQRRGYRDAHGGAGLTDLRKSISQSVNYYYYKLAYEMGVTRFDHYMALFGFGQRSGIDMAGEAVGIVPSPEWKAKHSKDPWYAGETVIAGIGQGYWVATVLQLVRGTAAIANGGTLHPLHLVSARRDGYKTGWKALPRATGPLITSNPAHLKAVQEGMVATVHGGGTATVIAPGATFLMAGKTGTAQNVGRRANVGSDPHSLPYNLRHQALFIAYAPADNPQIAIAVSVEHGGYGASSAAPIARKVFDAWLTGVMPTPTPDVKRSPQGGAPLDFVAEAKVGAAKAAVAHAKLPPPATPASPPPADDEEPAPESPTGNAQPPRPVPESIRANRRPASPAKPLDALDETHTPAAVPGR